MEDATDVADVLERAAEVIEERGWCQSKIEEVDGRVCLIGSIKAATGVPLDSVASLDPANVPPLWVRAAQAVDRVIQTEHAGTWSADWNDCAGRDKYEVIDLLKTVAKEIRNEATR